MNDIPKGLTGIVEGATRYQGDTYVTITVLVLVFAGVVLIGVPLLRHFIKSSELFGNAIDTMAGVVTTTSHKVEETNARTLRIESDMKRVLYFNSVATVAVGKVADKSGVNINAELAEMRGTLVRPELGPGTPMPPTVPKE